MRLLSKSLQLTLCGILLSWATHSYAACVGTACLNSSNAWIFKDDGEYGTDSFEFMDSSNFPLSVLQLRQTYPEKSIIFGGFLEMEAQSWFGDRLPNGTGVGQSTAPNGYQNGSGIGISSANLDVVANINHWAQTFVQFNAAAGEFESAFINIGNLSDSPFFMTLGRNRPRFGQFPAAPWAPNLTQGMVRPGFINTATVGYDHNNLNINLIAFNGASHHANGFMGSVFYNNTITQAWAYQVNAGITNDMRGLDNSFSDALQQRDAAINIEGSLAYQLVSATGGFFSGLNKVAATQNKHTNIWYAQLAYTPKILGRHVAFAVNYSQAQNTQQIAMPLAGDSEKGPSVYGAHKEWIAYVDTNVWKRTNVGLEEAWVETYDGKHTNTVSLYIATCF